MPVFSHSRKPLAGVILTVASGILLAAPAKAPAVGPMLFKIVNKSKGDYTLISRAFVKDTGEGALTKPGGQLLLTEDGQPTLFDGEFPKGPSKDAAKLVMLMGGESSYAKIQFVDSGKDVAVSFDVQDEKNNAVTFTGEWTRQGGFLNKGKKESWILRPVGNVPAGLTFDEGTNTFTITKATWK